METDDLKSESQPSGAGSTPSSVTATPTASTTTASSSLTTTTAAKTLKPSITLPEVDLYLHLLVLLFAIDRQKYKQVRIY